MYLKSKDEFFIITGDILNSNIYKDLDNELHHGITRYGHCLRVAKVTYRFAKKFNLNYVSATRAALLHDFYFDYQFKEMNIETEKEKGRTHPEIAALNAEKHFHINELEKNIIISHMYPVGKSKNKPKYKESWLLIAIDKIVAFHEMYRYKLGLIANILIIFAFNMITVQR